jgi:uncharacterized repeat protein (TIGR02543 family)
MKTNSNARVSILLSVIATVILLSGCPIEPPPTYTVTFESNGGSAAGPQTVSEGGTVAAPAAPARSGFAFAEWYSDIALSAPWDFAADTVTGDMTLYAKWTSNTYTITYSANGSDGLLGEGQIVIRGGLFEQKDSHSLYARGESAA